MKMKKKKGLRSDHLIQYKYKNSHLEESLRKQKKNPGNKAKEIGLKILQARSKERLSQAALVEQAIRRAGLRNGLSKKNISKQIGCKRQATISAFEAGEFGVRLQMLLDVLECLCLDLQIVELGSGDIDPKKKEMDKVLVKLIASLVHA